MWERRLEATGPDALHDKHNLATPSPLTDGTRVFAWLGTGQVVALDRNGAVVWQRHLGHSDAAPLVDEIAARYARRLGHAARVFGGSSSGAAACGVCNIRP